MRTVLVHFVYSLRQLQRQPNTGLRLLLLVPVAQVLPILLMGNTFLPRESTEWFFYTNLAWGFMASCALQALVWTQVVITTARLDMILLVDGGLWRWITGFTAALNALYVMSTCISTLVIALILGFPVQAGMVAVTLVASVPVSLGCIAFILGCEIRWGRVLHIVNTALDAVMVLSGVIYPVVALGIVFGYISQALPTAQLNEFLRGGSPYHILAALLLACSYAAVGFLWVRKSVSRYRVSGVIGRVG